MKTYKNYEIEVTYKVVLGAATIILYDLDDIKALIDHHIKQFLVEDKIKELEDKYHVLIRYDYKEQCYAYTSLKRNVKVLSLCDTLEELELKLEELYG